MSPRRSRQALGARKICGSNRLCCTEGPRLILGHIAVRLHHNQRPFEGLKPAPRKYWDMFERSKIPLSDEGLSFTPVKSNGFVVPPPRLRVAPPEAA